MIPVLWSFITSLDWQEIIDLAGWLELTYLAKTVSEGLRIRSIKQPRDTLHVLAEGRGLATVGFCRSGVAHTIDLHLDSGTDARRITIGGNQSLCR